MDVALITEGSYPYRPGGVSVWCDQLVNGLAEHRFHLVALTATGSEQISWRLPSNVATVRSVPLWGPPLWSPVWSLSRSPHTRAGRELARRVERVVDDLADALLGTDPTVAAECFRAAMAGWTELGRSADLEAALISRRFVHRVLRQAADPAHGGGQRGEPDIALGDVVTVARMIAHALRPLQSPPPHVDLVHLMANGLCGLVALAAKWLRGTPFVLSEHGVYLRERYLAFSQSSYPWAVKVLMLRFYRLLVGLVYTEAALVVPGNLYNRRWERRDGVRERVIRTVYNGIDPAEFAGVGPEPERPTLAWVGRVDPLKDLETLVRGFALVHARRPEVRLRIFGGTPAGNERYRDRVQDLIGELGLAGAAVLEGRVERVQDAYAAGTVIALTSISEGFPYTVIEAMSSARATVSTDVGGVAEAVGEAGLVVPPRDPAAFAAACLELFEDPERRGRLAEDARRRVLERFTLERSLDDFRSIYHSVPARAVAG